MESEKIVWTVTLDKSYCRLHFDFENAGMAEMFAETAANNYRADDEKFSASITAKFANNVTAETGNDDEDTVVFGK